MFRYRTSPSALCVSTLCRLAVLAVIVLSGCASEGSSHLPTSASAISVSTHILELPSANMRFDLYRPASQVSAPGRAPLVVVVHGLFRDRTHMAGWGKRLAAEGFVVAVP